MASSRSALYRLFQRSPIHRMPTEVLIEIFLLVRDGSIITSPSTTLHHDQIYVANLALFQMTAVCSRWRLVAVDFGLLWNNIAFSTLKASSIQCAELFLGRTKGCALYVYISAATLLDTHAISPTMHELLVKISSESYRVRVFDFFATERTKVLYTYWADPVINLHRIRGIRGSELASSCRFPRVESMSLSSPTWYPGIAPCLKNLKLRNNDRSVSLSSLLRALGECPVLESLRLQGYRQFVDEDSPDTLVTTLPNLHHLRLFFCNSAPILASLHLPSLIHPLVILDSDPRDDILRHLQRQHGASYLKNISKLRVVLDMGNSQYSIAAYREDGRMNLYLGVSTLSYLLRWQWIRESLEMITSFGPFSQVTSLSITADIIFASWSPWLSRMRHLSRLDLCSHDATSYLASLSASVDGSPLCPSLRTLALRGFQQSSKFDHGLLKACISSRRAAGCPLTFVLIPEHEWTQIRASDSSWDALVDSQGKFLIIHHTCRP